MQRIIYLRTGISRFHRFVDLYYSPKNTILFTAKRCLTNDKKNEKELDIKTGLYEPSTFVEEQTIPNLHSGQPKETIETAPKSTATLTGGGKVWSVQDPGSIHIAPLGAVATTVIPSTSADGISTHQTTVHTTQGELNIADPFKTHPLQPEPTPGQLAEAAAASAFEPFAPHTPLHTPPATDTTFAPKIFSADNHSGAISPTGQYENATPPTHPEATIYERNTQSSVYGGHDTSASSKNDSKENLYATTASDTTTKEIPVQRESGIRDEILLKALTYVDEKGWTLDAIRAGIQASNQPSTVEGLFSNGYDLVEYFTRNANAKMAAYMEEKSQKGESQGTRLLIDGLKYRLSLVIPYARTWDQALAQGALPQNAMRGWKNILDLSSDAWHGIGDKSADISWYSKRLILAAIYKSSEIFMLQDQSPEKIDTMNFLERRIGDFQSVGSARNSVSKSLSDTAQVASGLFSVVRNLTSRR